MEIDRRDFLQIAAAGAFTRPFARYSSIKAVAFDGLAIFDPRPVFARVEALFPGKGAAISEIWRTKQFEYTWLRTSAHDYADFWEVTKESLAYAAAKSSVNMKREDLVTLMNEYLQLKAWPDVLPAIKKLKAANIKLVVLSNFTGRMLDFCTAKSGLGGTFERLISTDMAKTYKPDPKAYQLGIDILGLKKQEILFAPFAAWDSYGAKKFGYPTLWVNRQNQPPEEMAIRPDGIGANLGDLVRYLGI